MIFLFFGSSLAHLEPELEPFEVWEIAISPKLQTVLTRLPEGLERFQKKGNSSEFNPRNYEQVKSSPSLQVLSHESVKDAVKFDKRVKLRVP